MKLDKETELVVDFIQNKLRPFVQQHAKQPIPRSEAYAHMDAETFFDTLYCPDCHEYSHYFKQRLFEYDKKCLVRAVAFAQKLREENSKHNSGQTMYKPRLSRLRCLKPYKVYHHHIQGDHDSLVHCFLSAFTQNRATAKEWLSPSQTSLLPEQLTGHWVIYVVKEDGSRLYLDVVQHSSNGELNSEPYDADAYLTSTGLENYRSEFPELFPIG